MEKMIIEAKKIKGSVNIPPSKSMAHRAIICASLAKGISVINNIDLSDDIVATLDAMKALGANIRITGSSLIIDGSETLLKKNKTIDCNESGSTLRFMIPISIAKGNIVNFIGKGNLGNRPLDLYYNIFKKQEIKYTKDDSGLNLNINGKLKNGEFNVEGNVSSQFISGLLFALPLVEGDSIIKVTKNLESKAYVDLTISMLNKFGIEIVNKEYKEFYIKGNQRYLPSSYKIESDYSSAAFFLCAGALGNDITCKGLDVLSLQSDKMVLQILESMGAKIHSNGKDIKVVGNELVGTIVDASECPDIIPIICLVASVAKGKTLIKNAKRLRIKECDRLSAITKELNALGAHIVEYEESLEIIGVDKLKGNKVYSHNDHRIAMTIAIASTVCDNKIELKNYSCVKKSYPKFWRDFTSLGGKIDG